MMLELYIGIYLLLGCVFTGFVIVKAQDISLHTSMSKFLKGCALLVVIWLPLLFLLSVPIFRNKFYGKENREEVEAEEKSIEAGKEES